MPETSEKIGRAALYLLLLAGPVLGLATKGFAPLLAIAGSISFIAVLMQPEKLQQVEFRKFIFALPFLFFMGLSLAWSQAENAGRSYFVLILVVVFTASLRISFKGMSLEGRDRFKHLLSASLLFGIIVSITIGSYPLFWPELSRLINSVSNQLTFANIELQRQSNRSLSLIPVFLFPIAGFYWSRAKWLFIPLIAIVFFITANSNSQTAFLAMLLGTIAFVFAYFYKYDGRRIIFAVTAIGLLFSPIIFLKSFEYNIVQDYAPQIVKQKASGEYREWIYYTYANEALSRPFLGHGLNSTRNFSPDNLNNYIELARERNLPHSLFHAHNFPLQVIFEFGYLGAILFLAAFWWLLNLRFDNAGLATHAATLAATLAAICGLLLFSYSLWQSWLLASLGFLYFYISILYRPDGQSNV
jgi:O-antigen ligase